jgi:hypothetical protein
VGVLFSLETISFDEQKIFSFMRSALGTFYGGQKLRGGTKSELPLVDLDGMGS